MIINQNLSGAIRILNPRIQFTQEMTLIIKKSKLQWGKRKIKIHAFKLRSLRLNSKSLRVEEKKKKKKKFQGPKKSNNPNECRID